MTTSAPTIAMNEVESSQIHSIGHDAQTNTLAIRFKNRATGEPGPLYHYENMTPQAFSEFSGAASIGSYFYKHIKPHVDKHPYVCIEKQPQATTNE